MLDPLENPLGLLGLEFIEFLSQDAGMPEQAFEALGFVKVAVHRMKDVVLYRQGGIDFIVNNAPDSSASCFQSGPGIAFRVKDAPAAYAHALAMGAVPLDPPAGPLEMRLPALQGIGGAPLYLFDGLEPGKSVYDLEFEFIANAERRPFGYGIKSIDHVGHAVYGGHRSYWAALYGCIFNSRTVRCVDIEGHSHCEGIRHIALVTESLGYTVDRLQAAGVPMNLGMSAASCRLLGVCFDVLQRQAGEHMDDARAPCSGDRARMCTL